MLQHREGRIDALILVLGSLLLGLLFVHVYGYGEALPESWVADACHVRCRCMYARLVVVWYRIAA